MVSIRDGNKDNTGTIALCWETFQLAITPTKEEARHVTSSQEKVKKYIKTITLRSIVGGWNVSAV